MTLGSGETSYRSSLAWAFLCVWLALAIDPADRVVWALENVLVLCLGGLIWICRREVPLSKASCTMIFAFLVLHEVAAHYTYPKVPYDAWIEAVTGVSLAADLGLGRNHYDRFMHLLFGLLLTVPMREALLHTSPLRRGWSYVLPVALSMAASAGYEMIEWLGADLFGGVRGPAFIGAQGDVWDAQKDMALATLGAVLVMAVAALRERGSARDLVGMHAAVGGGGGRLAGAR